jgi:hypothetical protein
MRSVKARLMCSLGLAALLVTVPALADPHGGGPPGRPPPGYAWDGRYQHDRYYPAHGHVVPAPPHGYRVVPHGGMPYYYYGGAWYRPYGARYVVVAPPVGLVVSFLPSFYTTLWWGGVPYYYADNVYYVARPAAGGYVVTEPPPGNPDRVESAQATVPAGEDFFMYPRNGQSAEQQGKDRYECHRWAVSQTGFDPTQSQGGVPVAESASRRSDYLRAITACLEARGYTVK